MVVDNATIDAQVDAGNYNIVTTRVTDMSNQFLNKILSTQIYLIGIHQMLPIWTGCFSGAISFNQPIGMWDLGKVTSMFGTFLPLRILINH